MEISGNRHMIVASLETLAMHITRTIAPAQGHVYTNTDESRAASRIFMIISLLFERVRRQELTHDSLLLPTSKSFQPAAKSHISCVCVMYACETQHFEAMSTVHRNVIR